MWTFERASALGLAIGVMLGLLAELSGLDHAVSGAAIYSAASAAVASAVGYFESWN